MKKLVSIMSLLILIALPFTNAVACGGDDGSGPDSGDKVYTSVID